MFSIGMRLQTCLAQNGSFSWSGWGGRGRTKGGKGRDYWPSCCIGHLGLQSLAWNEGLMYGHTVLSPRVCCFSVGSCCNTTLPVHVVCPLERTQSGPTGDSHTCGSVWDSVTFGHQRFPTFLCVQTFLCSQHICLWSSAQIFKPHLSSWESFKAIWALEEVFWCNFLSVSFSSWLLSLCTEEPRVPTHEVTLTTSWWLLHVSVSWAVEVRNPTLPLQPSKYRINK